MDENLKVKEETYFDPIATQSGRMPAKKTVKTNVFLPTIGFFVLYKLMGFFGAFICIGAFYLVKSVVKAKIPVVAKVALCILVVGMAVGLLIAIVIAAGFLQSAA